MAVTRRDVLKGAGTVAGLQVLSPLLFSGLTAAWGAVDPATANRRRLIVIDLGGGNDGLNTVTPVGDNERRRVYEQVRSHIKLTPSPAQTLDLHGDDGTLALNDKLKTLRALYGEGRLAVVQGCDYPNHNYSHFVSDDIWQSGSPLAAPDSGWIGRHVDRVGLTPGELRTIGIGGKFPLALRGQQTLGVQIDSLGATHFSDGNAAAAVARHNQYRKYSQHSAMEPLRQYYGETCEVTAAIDDATRGLTAAAPGGLASAMLTARALLGANLGSEVIFVSTGGYDTHTNELARHAALMQALDEGIEAFYYGTKGGAAITTGGAAGNGLPGPLETLPTPGTPIGPLSAALAERTTIMTFSEFGRRIGENQGTATDKGGTDHGAAGPMFFIGPPQPAAGSGTTRMIPGLHGDHPSLGTTVLPADNLAMTTDFRSVYQAVLTNWIDDPANPNPDGGDPNFSGALAGLFGPA